MTDRTRYVLGIDPALTTAWVLLRLVNGSAFVHHHGVWSLKQSNLEGGGMRYLRLDAWLSEVLTLETVHLVSMEDVRRHEGTKAAHLYGAITGKVTEVAERHDVPYEGIPVGEWKKLATGKGNASKDMVQSHAARRWGADAAIWTQDECDAAFIALAAARRLGWVRV